VQETAAQKAVTPKNLLIVGGQYKYIRLAFDWMLLCCTGTSDRSMPKLRERYEIFESFRAAEACEFLGFDPVLVHQAQYYGRNPNFNPHFQDIDNVYQTFPAGHTTRKVAVHCLASAQLPGRSEFDDSELDALVSMNMEFAQDLSAALDEVRERNRQEEQAVRESR
jgi:hypothetical protein